VSALRIIAAGPLTTLQDGGRAGWLRFGVAVSGAMDQASLAIANTLVGNDWHEGALEMTLAGGIFSVEGGAVSVALAGADMAATLEGTPVPVGRSFMLRPGARLRLGSAHAGARTYLSVAGGFAASAVFGSVATHLRSGIGGFAGRALADGDLLPLKAHEMAGADRALPSDHAAPTSPRVRVVLGPQQDYFTAGAIDTLLAAEYEITAQADRMGYRLAGLPLAHAKGYDLISDAIAAGTIQVPGNRQPILLLADRQTTGGYPKIATVISADLPALGQRRPGEKLRFAAVGLAEAAAARRAFLAWRDGLPASLLPLGAGFDSEKLLGANLISGVTDGA
jgi:5-oxoprolinase (ATP-hydrolysing) subunit C